MTSWPAFLALWHAIGWHYAALSERPDQVFILDAIADVMRRVHRYGL